MVLFNEAWDRRRGLGGAIIQGCSVLGGLAAVFVGTWTMDSFSVGTGWRIALLLGASPIVLVIVTRVLMPESQA
jgi:MFS family permease